MICAINIAVGNVKLKVIWEGLPIETVLAQIDILVERWGLDSEDVDLYVKPKYLPKVIWELILPLQDFNKLRERK